MQIAAAYQLPNSQTKLSPQASVVFKDGKVVKDREPETGHGTDALVYTEASRQYLSHTAPKSGYLTCCRCGHNKRGTEFYPSDKSTTGRRRRCKACERELAIARYAKRKAKEAASEQGFEAWWQLNSQAITIKGRTMRLYAGVLAEPEARRLWLDAEAGIRRSKDQVIVQLERKLGHIKALAASL